MEHADAKRRLRVRTNADTAEDAARARRFGAQGIGLCRTEHMFLGERRGLVENLIVADSEEEQEAALAELLPLQRADFTEIFEAMDGQPVTIRMIDPPLHEFLPDITELSVAMAVADVRGHRKKRQRKLLAAVQRLHESNPMLGLRGVRLGIVIPGLFTMQARAILEAASERIKAGGRAEPEIMIPLVGVGPRARHRQGQDRRGRAGGARSSRASRCPFKIGTMIELPRAALTADQIAGSAEFFSFGTNDLTQMTWGFSRDDVEASFFSTYLEHGRLPGLAVRVPRRRGRRRAGQEGGRARPRHPSRPAPRRLWRARRRPAVGALLRRRGPRLRVVLAVPGPGGPAGGRPLGRRRRLRTPVVGGRAASAASVSRPRTAPRPAAADP